MPYVIFNWNTKQYLYWKWVSDLILEATLFPSECNTSLAFWLGADAEDM